MHELSAQVVKGLRVDGKKPLSMIADTTTANAQVLTTYTLHHTSYTLRTSFSSRLLASRPRLSRSMASEVFHALPCNSVASLLKSPFETLTHPPIRDPKLLNQLLNPGIVPPGLC